MATGTTVQERELLQGARDGDQGAFETLVRPYHGELHAHCYRMVGSVHDAEDALQEAMLRAWRAIAKFEGRSSLRSWLYTIATNTCLNLIARRPKRVLPLDYGPSFDPHDQGIGMPPVEATWVEPYPDQGLGLEDGYAAPEARYELRESVELGFSAQETAESLDTSVASVNSALQRARKTVDEKLPEQSQQESLRTLGDDGVRDVVEGYMAAMAEGDVNKVVSLLAEDAAWSMPPLAAWFRGDELEGFLRFGPLSGDWRWRHLPAQANGQPAVGSYAWHPGEGAYLPFALDVLAIEGDRIKEITSFICRSTESDDPDYFVRWPEQPVDLEHVEAFFGRFGLPGRLED